VIKKNKGDNRKTIQFMEQYNIDLPNNRKGTVIQKKEFMDVEPSPLNFGIFIPKRIGYCVVTNSPEEGRKEYRVFKTKRGKWLKIRENEITTAIKKAIDEYEKKKS
jgi:hypothetical protein